VPIRPWRCASAIAAAWLALAATTADAQAPRPGAQAPRPAQTLVVGDTRFVLVPGGDGSATIRVTRAGREILSVTRTSGAFDPAQNRSWVRLEDANFDGWPDLWVLEAAGMVNTSYSLELFDPRTGRFVPAPDFAPLSNPQVDRRLRRITTFERGGCCAHTEGSWRWRDGALDLMAEHGDEAVSGPEGAVCFVRLWRRDAGRPARPLRAAPRLQPQRRAGARVPRRAAARRPRDALAARGLWANSTCRRRTRRPTGRSPGSARRCRWSRGRTARPGRCACAPGRRSAG
jgi:hypothetical protein